MIELLLAAALTIPAHTAEDRRIAITVKRGTVTRVRGTVVDFECDEFGNVGPKRFDVRVKARVDRRGRFSFVTGDRAERVGVAGYVRGRRKGRGRVRISGTIATGQPCSSPIVRFR